MPFTTTPEPVIEQPTPSDTVTETSGRWFCDTCGWYTKSEGEQKAHLRDSGHAMRLES